MANFAGITTTFSAFAGMPKRPDCRSAMALRRSRIPWAGAYRVRPDCIARYAASWIPFGVGKSGSPM